MLNFHHLRQVSASALALALMSTSSLAFAQNEASSASADRGEVSEGDIVVTGLKRDSKLIEAPVSISVFDSESIVNAGIQKPTDFLQLTPNVDIVSSVNAGDFLINVRGQASIRNAEPSVAILIDGVKIGSPAEFNSALFDLEQIEVLKGPQGTVYGRNASAGAIVITTKKPTEEFTGSGMFSYGKFGTYNANASLSGQIMPGLTARISGAFTGTDGSYTNVNTGEKTQRFKEEVGRLRLRWDDGGPFTADGRILLSHATGGAVTYTAKIQAVPGLSPNGTIVHGIPITDISANKNLNIPFISDVPGRYERDIFSTGMMLNYDFESADLTSITGYSNVRQFSSGKNYPYSNASDPTTNYFGWTPIFGDRTQNLVIKTKQFMQELRLTSKPDDFLEWQVGGEFVWNKRDYRIGNTLNGALPAGITAAELVGYVGYNAAGQRTLVGGGNAIPFPVGIFGLNSAYPTTNLVEDRFVGKNYAPFANVTMHFTKQLSLELAGRYDIEKRSTGSIGPDQPNPFLGGASYNACVRITGQTAAQCADGISKTFKQFQPKATLTYKIGDNASAYASWGRSFKSGGFNPIGTRETAVLSRVTLFRQQDPTLSAAAARARAEAAIITQDTFKKEVATTYEVGFKSELFDRVLTLNTALFWTDVKNNQQYVFDPIAFVESIESIDKSRIKGLEIDATVRPTKWLTFFGAFGYIDAKIRKLAANPAAVGKTPPYVPETTLTLGSSVDIPLDDTKNFIGRVEYNRTGRTEYNTINDPDFARTPYSVVNGRLGIKTDNWDMTLWGRNLFNKRYVKEIAPIIAGTANAFSLADLRTYGLEVRFRF